MEEKTRLDELDMAEIFRLIDMMQDDNDLVVWIPKLMQKDNSCDR